MASGWVGEINIIANLSSAELDGTELGNTSFSRIILFSLADLLCNVLAVNHYKLITNLQKRD